MTAFATIVTIFTLITGFTAAEDQFVIIDNRPVNCQNLDNACLLQGTVATLQLATKAAETAELITTILSGTTDCFIKLTNSRDEKKFKKVLSMTDTIFDKHYTSDNSASEAELDILLAKESKTITNNEDRAEFDKEIANQKLSRQQDLFLKLSTADGLKNEARNLLEKKGLTNAYSEFKMNVEMIKQMGITIENGIWIFNTSLSKLAADQKANKSFRKLFNATDRDLTQLSSPIRREAVVIGNYVFGPPMKKIIVTPTNNKVEDGKIREWTKEEYRKEAQHLLTQFKRSVDNLSDIRSEKYKQLEPRAMEQVNMNSMWLKAIGLPESIQQNVDDINEKSQKGNNCWGIGRDFTNLEDFLNKKLFIYKPCDDRSSMSETKK